MTTTTETKCSACGMWQIRLNYCPYCGHKHTSEFYRLREEDKIYTCEVKDGELPPVVRFKEKK